MENIERLLITKDKTQEMSASDLKELTIQYGWFADDPPRILKTLASVLMTG